MLIARLIGVINAVWPRRGIVVCCAPVPEGNRGDQALLLAVCRELQSAAEQDASLRPVHLVETAGHPILSVKPDDTFRIHRQYAQVFNTMKSPKERLAFLWFLRGKKTLVLIGADVLDEGYAPDRSRASIDAMSLASAAGVPNRIIGFSINDTSSPGLGQRLKRARENGTQLFARDAVTHQRLIDAGIKDARLVGDLALLMPPAEFEELPADLQEFFNDHAGQVVGLNFTEVVMGSGEFKDRLFANVAAAAKTLGDERGQRFVLIPHDDQGGVEYLQALYAVMQEACPDYVRMVEPMPGAPILKRIAGSCVHVFTCRLHLGIATLGMSRPVTGFPYQGKWEGQFAHFEIQGGLVPKESLPADPDAFTQLMRDRIDASDAVAAQVASRLPEVKALSRANFDGVIPAQ